MPKGLRTSQFERLFDKLISGAPGDLEVFLPAVDAVCSVKGTSAEVHCRAIALDGDQMPRVEGLVEELALRMLDYVIPRKDIAEARALDLRSNTTRHTMALRRRAAHLFTDSVTTGEVGELFLYALTESFLALPQLFCKMSLKTNSKVHVHGIDGIHARFEKGSSRLELYWGESKLYATLQTALTECFKSLHPFFDPKSSGTRRERDLELVRTNLDLNNPDLEAALLNYFNPRHSDFNRVESCAHCLVGFDSTHYPKSPKKVLQASLDQLFKKDLPDWVTATADSIKAKSPLHKIKMTVFLIPIPSVEKFRKLFLKELGLS